MTKTKGLLAFMLLAAMTWSADLSAQLTVYNTTGCDLRGRVTWQIPFTCTNSGGDVINAPANSVVIIPIPPGLTTHFVLIYQGTPWAFTYVSDGCAFPSVDQINPMVGCVTMPTSVAISGNVVKIYQ